MIQANKITDINESLKVYQSTLELYKDVDWRDLPNPKRGRSILAEVKGEIARLENEVRMDLLEKELERKRAEAEAGGEENDASDGDANEDSPAESSQAGGQL